MPIHKNCYELVREVRQGVNEYNDALASGDEVSGAYRNDFIIQQINAAVDQLYALIAPRRPDEFLTEVSLTPINSVITLPSDYGKLILLRDQDGRKVLPIAQDQRRYTAQTGSERQYYRKKNTLVLDRAGVTDPYTLIYKAKPRSIHMGSAPAGGALSITLNTKLASDVADFYNGMTIEDVTQETASTITDYTTARVATVSFNGVAGDAYALVPEIPEWAHGLISPKATIMCKLHPISQEPPSKMELQQFQEQLISVFREFATPDEDVDWEEMFTSFEPSIRATW
jgi:hypothetical protein